MEKQSEYKVDMREAFKIYLDERGCMYRASDINSVAHCPKEGKEGPYSTYDDRMYMIDDQEIQINWQHIETCLKMNRNRYIERGEAEFWTRLEMVTKGMR